MTHDDWLKIPDVGISTSELQNEGVGLCTWATRMLRWVSELPFPLLTMRKRQLLVAACARQVWPLLLDLGREAVESAEETEDRVEFDFEKILNEARWNTVDPDSITATAMAGLCVLDHPHITASFFGYHINRIIPESIQIGIIRDLFGDPYCCLVRMGNAVSVGNATAQDPFFIQLDDMTSWLTPDVKRLAESAYRCRVYSSCPWCKPDGNPDQCVCKGTRMYDTGILDSLCLVALADSLEESGCRTEYLLSHLRGPALHVRGCWALDLILGK